MTPNPFTEDQLVEKPAIDLFEQLGWQTVSSLERTIVANVAGIFEG